MVFVLLDWTEATPGSGCSNASNHHSPVESTRVSQMGPDQESREEKMEEMAKGAENGEEFGKRDLCRRSMMDSVSLLI